MIDDERDAWIALASVPGVGEETFWALVAEHGGALPAMRAVGAGRDTILQQMHPRRSVRGAIEAAARGDIAAGLRRTELGVWTITALDADYPDRLRVLDPPPAIIHGWGEAVSLSADRAVAVVGTRRPTIEGRALAARIATRLAEVGAVVVSGLAIGVDGAAHAASVAQGARTVAVIGGGHAQPGPRAHRRLVGGILDHGGAVVSEHGPDTVPSRGTFPRRNRIISALGDATIVVEAPARSGALITARHALEQGRPVFAVPGRPNDPHVHGCLALLRETPARPFVGLDELVVDLGYDTERDPAGTASGQLTLDGALGLLGPAEQAVARRIARGPAGPEALVAATGLAPSVVSGALTLLLLRGWVHPMGPAYLAAGPLLAARK